jgi:hypothetical protein
MSGPWTLTIKNPAAATIMMHIVGEFNGIVSPYCRSAQDTKKLSYFNYILDKDIVEFFLRFWTLKIQSLSIMIII